MEAYESLEATDNVNDVTTAPFKFRHFPEFDGFRGLAVLLVIIGHWLKFSIASLSDLGDHAAQLGVVLFFVLSGFLITGLLLRERRETGGVNLKAFYVRRVLRLAPALALFLVVAALLVKLRLLPEIPRYEFAACVLYVRNIFGRSASLGHLWSLSLEEQFYMLWPLTLFLAPTRRLFAIAAVSALLVAVARTIGIIAYPAVYVTGVFYMRPWFRFDSILAGCCVVIGLTQGARAARMMRTIGSRIHPLFSWPLLLGWSLLGERISRPLFITIQLALATLVLLQIALSSTESVLSRPWLRFFGKISYSLYLWQQLFLVVNWPSWGVLRVFPLNIGLPLALAIGSFYVVERPILSLKNRWQLTS